MDLLENSSLENLHLAIRFRGISQCERGRRAGWTRNVPGPGDQSSAGRKIY
jgi:hypothetical protein